MYKRYFKQNNKESYKKYLLTIEENGNEISIQVNSEKTILKNCLDQKIDMNYSCMNGICKKCKVYTKDIVKTVYNVNTLTQEEKDKGAILTCCSFPVNDIRIKK